MSATTGSLRRSRIGLLLLLLLLALSLKLTFNPGLGRNALDGDFYFQIARHVAEGDGLQTSVSLYHQGLRELPHPTNLHPLWPLLLGWAGRWIGMFRAAALLPELLYLAALGLAYPLGGRLVERLRGVPGPGLAVPRGVLTGGHAAVLVLALNPVFFHFTSLPYTEALAFVLLFATLLLADALAQRPGLVGGLAVGAAGGLAFLTRGQMVGLPVAVIAVLLVLSLRDRRWLAAAGGVVAAFALTVLPWVLFLASFISPLTPGILVSYGSYRETPQLEPFQISLPADDLPSLLADRATGLAVAFDPTSSMSYVANFGPVVWLVPLAVAWGAWRLLRRRGAGLVAMARLDAARLLLPGLVAATGVLLLIPVHMLHAGFFLEWLFGFRHGLPMALLVFVALFALAVHAGRLLRVTAVLLFAGTVLLNALSLQGQLRRAGGWGLRGAEPALVAWLDAQPGKPTVVTTEAQTLSVFSRAGFHWTTCEVEAQQTRRMLRHLPIDYVVVFEGEQGCPFVTGVPELALVRTFGRPGMRIWVLAPLTPRTRSTAPPAPTAPG